MDHADEFVAPVAVGAGELDELVDRAEDSSVQGCAGDGDAAPTAEFEQALVAQGAQSAQHGVCVDAEHGCHVFGEREPLARTSFAVGDRAADFRCDLEIERGWF